MLKVLGQKMFRSPPASPRNPPGSQSSEAVADVADTQSGQLKLNNFALDATMSRIYWHVNVQKLRPASPPKSPDHPSSGAVDALVADAKRLQPSNYAEHLEMQYKKLAQQRQFFSIELDVLRQQTRCEASVLRQQTWHDVELFEQRLAHKVQRMRDRVAEMAAQRFAPPERIQEVAQMQARLAEVTAQMKLTERAWSAAKVALGAPDPKKDPTPIDR